LLRRYSVGVLPISLSLKPRNIVDRAAERRGAPAIGSARVGSSRGAIGRRR
jgi:hypothetical protein